MQPPTRRSRLVVTGALADDGSVATGRRASGVAQTLVQMARLLQEKRGSDDLHAVQWAALRYFARAGRRAATVQGLSRYLGNTSGSASRTVKSLLDRGLLSGRALREDARSTTFSLTPEGEAALRRDPLIEVAAAVDMLDEADLNRLGSLLDAVQTALERQRR